MSLRITTQLSGLFCLVFSISVSAKVQYDINVEQPEHHLAQITMTVPQGRKQLNLYLPAWRTGKYKILNHANGVRHFNATTAKQKALEWHRVDKSHWLVNNPTEGKVIIRYQLYANELANRTRHIDGSHAYLDATSVLMYERQMMDDVHQVKLSVPENWRSFSGMMAVAEHEFIAQSYHQLASSPIETGINKLREFRVDGRNYQLVIWGQGNYDIKKMASDLKSLVRQGKTIWQGYPFKKYLFIVHATSGASGATEHINSTIIQRPRFTFAPQEKYLKFLGTAAHEFVHTWNVKAYRPAELVPYDYQKENYSDLLWMAEGSTSYFQGRLLLTAKLQTVKDFLKDLSHRIHTFQHRPGRKLQSVSESSLEQWIAQGGDFANNYSVNIYSEGYMASWLFDTRMLQDSALKSGYKMLHNELFRLVDIQDSEFKRYHSTAYTAEQVQQLAHQLTGEDYQRWWQENIESALEIDFDDLLELAGLRFAEQKSDAFKPWLGFKSNEQKGLMTLTSVEKDGPAWSAGLTAGDQIVAINQLKVTHKGLESHLELFDSGDSIEITFFRNDQLQVKTLVLDTVSKKPRAIELLKSPSDEQKSFFKAWLGIEFPETEDRS